MIGILCMYNTTYPLHYSAIKEEKEGDSSLPSASRQPEDSSCRRASCQPEDSSRQVEDSSRCRASHHAEDSSHRSASQRTAVVAVAARGQPDEVS